jgi:hypothetical protein
MKANAFIAAIFVLFMCTMPVASAASQFYTNKYVDNNPALLVQEPSSYGYVIFYIRAGGSAQDTTIWYYNLNTQRGIQEFDPSFLPDRVKIEGQNPGYKSIKTLPIGETDLMKLPAGQYRAFLQNGNANQMEVFDFIVGGGDITRVTFLGAGVTNHHDDCITKPAHEEYRFRDLIPAGTHIEGFDEVNHTVTITDKEAWDETVTDTEAWDEYIYHPEVNHTVHHDEVNHTETVVDTEAWDEYIYHPEVNHTVTVTDKEAWDEYIYHPEVNHTVTITDEEAIPAWTESVYHPEVNHTESQTPTCTETSSNYAGTYRDRGDYYEWENGYLAEYVVQSAVANTCGGYKLVGGHFEKTSRCGDNRYDLTFAPARTCVDNAFVDGTCGGLLPTGGISRCSPLHPVPVCDPACVCAERIVVDTEAYTETINHPEIPAVTHDEIVVDEPAYTETIHHDAITHDEIVVDEPAYTETIHHEAGTHEVIVVDTPAYDEIVVDEEAYTETIHHEAGTHVVHHDAVTHDEIVVDEPAHCDEITTGEQYWGEWSEWTTTPYTAIQGVREVEQKTVPKSVSCGSDRVCVGKK